MTSATVSYGLTPLLPILAIGALLALAAAAWLWLRQRDARPASRLRALTVLTLFLTFDLVLFGAFTRLTDSGLGCPDWPGCYGTASPVGAQAQIAAAQTAMPNGPVTHEKAWIEMVHRYLATSVGALITWLAVLSWRGRRNGAHGAGEPPGPSPWWATATLAWVCLQGAFGALTVTMKLYPAIVTAHLLGGIGLLVLLAVQSEQHVPKALPMSRRLVAATSAVAALAVLQIALGGWVSTNYAVLACRDFPTCQGSLWPSMDFGHGFTLLRGLGVDRQGQSLPFAALTAIHYAHRIGAAVLLSAMALLAWRLNAGGGPAWRRASLAITAVGAWQLLSGLGNVVLGRPLLAALAHTGGAAVLVTLLAVLLCRARVPSRRAVPMPMPMRQAAREPGSPRLREAP